MKKSRYFIIAFLAVCTLGLCSCGKEEDPAQEVVDEFIKEADEFLEKNETEEPEKLSGPFVLKTVYSDYAAKITAPDGFYYQKFANNVFEEYEEQYPITNLLLNNDGVSTMISYGFYEYDPFETMDDVEYMEESEDYSEIAVTDTIGKTIKGYDIQYKKLTFLSDGETYNKKYTICMPVNEFQYFCVKVEYGASKPAEFDDEIVENIFNGIELYETGEEPLVTYDWSKEIEADENGYYHIKDVQNSKIKAEISIPEGYEYEGSNTGTVSFYKRGRNDSYYSISYQFAEQKFLSSPQEELDYMGILPDSEFHTAPEKTETKRMDIEGDEVRYTRIDYADTSGDFFYTEYLSYLPLGNDYLTAHLRYSGNEPAELDDSVVEEMIGNIRKKEN